MARLAVYINDVIKSEIDKLSSDDDGFKMQKNSRRNRKNNRKNNITIQLNSEIRDRILRLNILDSFLSKINGDVYFDDHHDLLDNDFIFIFSHILEVRYNNNSYTTSYNYDFLLYGYPYLCEAFRKCFSDVISFREICNRQVESFHNSDILVETEKGGYIFNSIVKLNELGYLTFSSQTGSRSEKNIKYPIYEEYGYFQEQNSKKVKYRTGYFQQRAQISGFLPKSVAIRVYEKLKNDKYIIVGMDETKSDTFGNGSVYFNNEGRIVSTKEPQRGKPYIPSYGLRDQNYNDITVLDIYPCLGSDEEIVYFRVAERRWNNNTYIWRKMIDTMLEVGM